MITSINRAYEAEKRSLADREMILEAVLGVDEVLPGSDEEMDDIIDVDSVPDDAYNRLDKMLDKIVEAEDYDDAEADELVEDEYDEDEVDDAEIDAIMEAYGLTGIIGEDIDSLSEGVIYALGEAALADDLDEGLGRAIYGAGVKAERKAKNIRREGEHKGRAAGAAAAADNAAKGGWDTNGGEGPLAAYEIAKRNAVKKHKKENAEELSKADKQAKLKGLGKALGGANRPGSRPSGSGPTAHATGRLARMNADASEFDDELEESVAMMDWSDIDMLAESVEMDDEMDEAAKKKAKRKIKIIESLKKRFAKKSKKAKNESFYGYDDGELDEAAVIIDLDVLCEDAEDMDDDEFEELCSICESTLDEDELDEGLKAAIGKHQYKSGKKLADRGTAEMNRLHDTESRIKGSIDRDHYRMRNAKYYLKSEERIGKGVAKMHKGAAKAGIDPKTGRPIGESKPKSGKGKGEKSDNSERKASIFSKLKAKSAVKNESAYEWLQEAAMWDIDAMLESTADMDDEEFDSFIEAVVNEDDTIDEGILGKFKKSTKGASAQNLSSDARVKRGYQSVDNLTSDLLKGNAAMMGKIKKVQNSSYDDEDPNLDESFTGEGDYSMSRYNDLRAIAEGAGYEAYNESYDNVYYDDLDEAVADLDEEEFSDLLECIDEDDEMDEACKAKAKKDLKDKREKTAKKTKKKKARKLKLLEVLKGKKKAKNESADMFLSEAADEVIDAMVDECDDMDDAEFDSFCEAVEYNDELSEMLESAMYDNDLLYECVIDAYLSPEFLSESAGDDLDEAMINMERDHKYAKTGARHLSGGEVDQRKEERRANVQRMRQDRIHNMNREQRMTAMDNREKKQQDLAAMSGKKGSARTQAKLADRAKREEAARRSAKWKKDQAKEQVAYGRVKDASEVRKKNAGQVRDQVGQWAEEKGRSIRTGAVRRGMQARAKTKAAFERVKNTYGSKEGVKAAANRGRSWFAGKSREASVAASRGAEAAKNHAREAAKKTREAASNAGIAARGAGRLAASGARNAASKMRSFAKSLSYKGKHEGSSSGGKRLANESYYGYNDYGLTAQDYYDNLLESCEAYLPDVYCLMEAYESLNDYDFDNLIETVANDDDINFMVESSIDWYNFINEDVDPVDDDYTSGSSGSSYSRLRAIAEGATGYEYDDDLDEAAKKKGNKPSKTVKQSSRESNKTIQVKKGARKIKLLEALKRKSKAAVARGIRNESYGWDGEDEDSLVESILYTYDLDEAVEGSMDMDDYEFANLCESIAEGDEDLDEGLGTKIQAKLNGISEADQERANAIGQRMVKYLNDGNQAAANKEAAKLNKILKTKKVKLPGKVQSALKKCSGGAKSPKNESMTAEEYIRALAEGTGMQDWDPEKAQDQAHQMGTAQASSDFKDWEDDSCPYTGEPEENENFPSGGNFEEPGSGFCGDGDC